MIPFPLAQHPRQYASHTLDEHIPVLLDAMVRRLVYAQRIIIEDLRVRDMELSLLGSQLTDFCTSRERIDIEKRLADHPVLEDDLSRWLASSRVAWDWGTDCLQGLYAEIYSYPKFFAHISVPRRIIHVLIIDARHPPRLHPKTPAPIPFINDAQAARRAYFETYHKPELGLRTWRRTSSPDWWYELQNTYFASPARPGRITA